MGRILAVDYGTKRVGLAVTDENRIIATGLETVHSTRVIEFIKDYIKREQVDRIVVGMPMQMNNKESENVRFVREFIKQVKKELPGIPVETEDERFTSKMASAAILSAGAKRKTRRDKSLVDKVSAVLILQSYLEKHRNQ
mgnify:CR=1 FL=1